MVPLTRALLASTLIPLAAGPPGKVDDLAFRPEPGMRIVRTFHLAGESNDHEHYSAINGEELDDPSGSTTTEEVDLLVTDVVVACEDGMITELLRTYDRFSTETIHTSEGQDGLSEWRSTGTTELEGEPVSFEWDGDSGEYEITSDGADEDLLGGLLMDLDFTLLLPEDEVEEGDTWEVDWEWFAAVLSPGSDLPIEWEHESSDGDVEVMDEADDAQFIELEPDLDESSDGEIRAEYAGMTEVDGLEVAHIRLEGELTWSMSAAFEFQEDVFSQSSLTETEEVQEIEGDCYWNVAEGRLHSLEIEIELNSETHMEGELSFDDEVIEHEADSEETGQSTLEVRFEVVRGE